MTARRTGTILLGLATTAMLTAGCGSGADTAQPKHSAGGASGAGAGSTEPGVGGSPDVTPGAVTITVDGTRQNTAAMPPVSCTTTGSGEPLIGQMAPVGGADGWVMALTKGAEPKLMSLTLTTSTGRLISNPLLLGVAAKVSVQGKTYSISTSAVDADRLEAGEDPTSLPRKPISIDATCP